MTHRANATPELAALLTRHREEIATAWTRMIFELPDSDKMTNHEETYSLITRSLTGMAEALTTGSYAYLESHLVDVATVCVENGTEIDAVIETLLIMTHAVLPIILQAYPAGSEAVQNALDQLESCLRWMTSYLAKMHTSQRNQCLHQQHASAEMLLQLAHQVSSTLNLDEILEHTRAALISVAPASQCLFYMVNKNTYRPAPADIDTICLDRFVAQTIETRRPLVHQESAGAGTHATLTIPFVMDGNRTCAVAILYADNGYASVTEEMIEAATGIANVAGPVIENACLHQQVEQHALLQERDRLAREVHDNLSQALGYLNMKVALLDEQLAKEQYALAQSNVREMAPIIELAYVDARETIFNLRSASSTASGMLLATLREYLRDYKMHYGVAVHLAEDDDFRAELPVRTSLQVTRIIQEAIANIRKHAGVCHACISLAQDDDSIHIVVEDNGVGFDVTGQKEAGVPHYGLQIMRERAESVGGALHIDSSPGEGTQVSITVPLTDRSEDAHGYHTNPAGG